MKYSVADIDRMRWAVAEMLWPAPNDVCVVEERLRTYMLNGTTYQELEEEAEKKRSVRQSHATYMIERGRPGGVTRWVP
jgi:hypothetical protein